MSEVESKSLTKDEKLSLATKIVGHLELSKAEKLDAYDILVIIGHLMFPGRAINLSVTDIKVL